MDNEAFETDVLSSVNESLYAEQWTADDSSGQAFTIGETWIGALYGLEENAYGQKVFYRFDTEAEQRAWFDGVTEGRVVREVAALLPDGLTASRIPAPGEPFTAVLVADASDVATIVKHDGFNEAVEVESGGASDSDYPTRHASITHAVSAILAHVGLTLRPDGRYDVADTREANQRYGCTGDTECILSDGHQGEHNPDRES